MQTDHSWLGTEVLKTRAGDFEFRNSYPTADTSKALRDLLLFNRAIEVYLVQMPAVAWNRVWEGVTAAAPEASNPFVIFEQLMNAKTLLLTGNTETVYGLCSIDLKNGPVVLEVPAMMLGGINDIWQREITGIGPTGADKGKGGKFLILPPDHEGKAPEGYFTFKAKTYHVSLGVRGFQQDGSTDHAVKLMKEARVYPLSAVDAPPPMTFINGSQSPIDTLFSDDLRFFEDLAAIIAREPVDTISSHERFPLAAIGIEHGKPFEPDAERQALLDEAARLGSAAARQNTFASNDPARMVYPDRTWEWLFVGGSAEWDAQGYENTDRRAAFGYAAIGMSPAMVEKIVGGGSQYLWTPRDARGAYLDGAKAYRLRLPPNVPVKNFWSVVVYDAASRSLLENGRPFPSISAYTGPVANSDGSTDIYFGPEEPGPGKNWIKTVPGKGWFPLIRFYGPLEPFFDKTWKPDDIAPAE